MSELEDFKRKRNEIFTTLDIAGAHELLGGKGGDEILLLSIHKARYECCDISPELRQISRKWLEERGYKRMFQEPFPADGSLPE